MLLATVFTIELVAQLKFKHLTINEGLSQNTVLCMLQDKEGYIWVGTEDGLNRYDGYEFRQYKHNAQNAKTLSNSSINAIVEDRNSNLWIATADGLNVLNKKTEIISRIRITSDKALQQNQDFINSLLLDDLDNLWIGTIEGLKCYSLKSNQLSKLTIQYGKVRINNDNRLQAIFKDQRGQLWIGTTSGLFLYNAENGQQLKLPASLALLGNDYIRVIKQDAKNRIWFGSETQGVFVYNSKDQTCVNFTRNGQPAHAASANSIRDIFFKSDEEAWLGTPEGLEILDVNTGKYIIETYSSIKESGISHNSIRNFLKDDAGNIWLGTYAGGINVYYPNNRKFNVLSVRNRNGSGLVHPVVSSIIEDENANLWIGTEGGGLNCYNVKTAKFSNYQIPSPFLNSNNIKALARKDQASVWVGTYNGLNLFNTVTQTFKKYSVGDDALLGSNQVYALVNTPKGLWVGTNGGGLRFLDGMGNAQAYLHDPVNEHSLSANNINVIVPDGANNLWIGTQKGLNYFDVQSKQSQSYYTIPGDEYSLSSNAILSLYVDSRQQLWVGTEGGGLNLFDRKTKRFYAITEAHGIGSNVIHAINEDALGNIWISTNKGLSRIKLIKQEEAPVSTNIEVFNYIAEDGLQSNQFSTGAGFRSQQSGILYFGGINGISWFNPADITRNKIKPRIVFTDIEIRNKKTDQAEDRLWATDSVLQLPYDHGSITFRFAALNFVTPGKNKYAYRLQGLENDEDWHYVDAAQRLATYTNLRAGTYYFSVKASNNDGVWSDQAKMIKIIVSPPFWKTWWAYLIYLLIIGTILYLIYHYSLKTAKLKNELHFEHLNHEKDKELAQHKIDFFTNISHEIKTPLTLILAPLERMIKSSRGGKVKSELQLIQRNGERLSRLVNQLLDFRKLESGNLVLHNTENDLVGFLKEVCLLFEGYAGRQKIALEFRSSYNSLSVWFDAERLERVLYNLLSNAVKFGRDSGTIIVWLRADDEAGSICIEVEDDGIGMDAAQQAVIFDGRKVNQDQNINGAGTGIGLAYSKGLVELMGGTIRVASRQAQEELPGHTCFTVSLPVLNEHLITGVSQEVSGETEALLYRAPATGEQPPGANADYDKADVEKRTMLIVEDNDDLLHFMADNFSGKFIVHTARNGKEGLTCLNEITADIIISDIMMPEMNGVEFCKAVKTDYRTSHIPFILLTARTPVMYKIEGYETGADDYMTKPFNLQLLEVRVNNLIASREELAQRFKTAFITSPRETVVSSPDDEFLVKVLAFIEENVTEPILNVENLAKELCMSQGALYRKIKALTGQTTIELIRNTRIKIAASLLRQKTMNINEVIYSVGFTDADYFRKCFKEQFGVTPRDYMNREDAAPE